MDRKVAAHLIGQGTVMGIVHVLSGPDHLSALAALTATVPPCKAFFAGVRWGMGHSTGLILVTCIFVSVEHEVMDTLAGYCEWIVGFLMIALGAWTMWRAFHADAPTPLPPLTPRERKSFSTAPAVAGASLELSGSGKGGKDGGSVEAGEKRRDERIGEGGEAQKGRRGSKEFVVVPLASPRGGDEVVAAVASPLSLSTEEEEAGGRSGGKEDGEGGARGVDIAEEGSAVIVRMDETTSTIIPPSSSSTTTTTTRVSLPPLQQQEEDEYTGGGSLPPQKKKGWCRPPTQLKEKMLSFVVGIVHGVAGPGGILGVLPAVELHDWSKSSLYPGTFCVLSSVTMGAFAALYGGVTYGLGRKVGGGEGGGEKGRVRAERLDFGLKVFSALLSVVVGVLWLALTATGKMEAVFGE